MKLVQRFKQSSIANQGNLIFGLLVMLATVANSFAVIFQYRSAKSNAIESSKQTNQLLAQAQLQATASQQSAQAAIDFSTSARAIDREVGNAVDKLGRQAAASQRIADVTTAASDASVQSIYLSTKPYVLPLLATTNLLDSCAVLHQKGEVSRCAALGYQNFGQTPALNVEAFAFVQVSGRSQTTPFPIGRCEGSTKSVLAKDEGDSCQVRLLDEDSRWLQSTAGMPGSAFIVRGYIAFDDVYGEHNEQEFCSFYPIQGQSIANRVRTCQLTGNLDAMRAKKSVPTSRIKLRRR